MHNFTIGIDLGGTHVRAITYDLKSHEFSEIKKVAFEYKDTVIDEVQANLVRLITTICQQEEYAGKKLVGIGIAMAALFERETGNITVWPNNQKWNGFALKAYLIEYFKVPVVFEDDANAAAMGEQLLGAAKGYKDFAYVTVSTGIGCGIVLNNEVFIGTHGWAGELGHIKVTNEEVVCTCGAKGCLQAKASGPALFKAYMEKSKSNASLTLEEIANRGKQGDSIAQSVFEEAGVFIGEAIANMVMLFDLPLIVLGGGVIEAGELILKPIQKGIAQALYPKRKVNVVCSDLRISNGVIGALALINQYVTKK